MPLSSCDDDRLTLALTAKAKLDEARRLAESGDYARALDCYLFAFDNGSAVSSWGGVRLSYIPSEIVELGNTYPPARIAMENRRDAREQLLRAGETDYNVVAEWASINRYLGDKERELNLLKEVQASGTLPESLKRKIVGDHFDQLLAERDYRLLADYFNDYGRRFLFEILHYEEARLFPDHQAGRLRIDQNKRRILTGGAKLLELAFGIGKQKQADEIIERILKHCYDAEAFATLVQVAKKAGKKRKARQLEVRAAQADLINDNVGSASTLGTGGRAETSVLTLLAAALDQVDVSDEKYDPIVTFVSNQAGVQSCFIVNSDAKVLASKGLERASAEAHAHEVAEILSGTVAVVASIKPSKLQGIILKSDSGYFVIFAFGPVTLVILSTEGLSQIL